MYRLPAASTATSWGSIRTPVAGPPSAPACDALVGERPGDGRDDPVGVELPDQAALGDEQVSGRVGGQRHRLGQRCRRRGHVVPPGPGRGPGDDPFLAGDEIEGPDDVGSLGIGDVEGGAVHGDAVGRCPTSVATPSPITPATRSRVGSPAAAPGSGPGVGRAPRSPRRARRRDAVWIHNLSPRHLREATEASSVRVERTPAPFHRAKVSSSPRLGSLAGPMPRCSLPTEHRCGRYGPVVEPPPRISSRWRT